MSKTQTLEDEVFRWLNKMGYRSADGRPLSKAQLAPVCRPAVQPLWAQLLSKVRPLEEAKQIRNSAERMKAKEAQDHDEAQAKRSEEVEQKHTMLTRKLADLQSCWEQEKASLRGLQDEAVTCMAGAAQQLSEAQDYTVQELALKTTCHRLGQLLPRFAGWNKLLITTLDLARSRSVAQVPGAASSPVKLPPGIGVKQAGNPAPNTELKLQQACQALVGELQSALKLQSAAYSGAAIAFEMGQESPPPGAAAGRVPGEIEPQVELSPAFVVQHGLQEQILHLLLDPPANFLQALKNLCSEAAEQLRTMAQQIDVAADAEELKLLAETHGATTDGSRPGSRATMMLQARQRAHFQQFLDTEAANTKVQMLLQQLEDVHDPTGVLSSTPGKLHVQLAHLQAEVAELEGQARRLMTGLEALQDAEGAAMRRWAAMNELNARDLELDRLMIWLAHQNHGMADACAEELPHMQRLIAEVASECEAAVAAAAPAKHLVGKEVEAFRKLALQLPQPQALLSTPLPQSLPSTLQRFQSTWGSLAASEHTAMGRTAGQAGCSDGTLSAVLKPAAQLVADIAFRCPAACLSSLVQRQQLLQEAQGQVDACKAMLDSAALQHSTCEELNDSLQQQVHDQLDEDMHVRMAVMEGATHMGQQAQQLCENGLRIALQDWWQQPATYVVPWHTRDGLNASEWAVQLQTLNAQVQAVSQTTAPA